MRKPPRRRRRGLDRSATTAATRARGGGSSTSSAGQLGDVGRLALDVDEHARRCRCGRSRRGRARRRGGTRTAGSPTPCTVPVTRRRVRVIGAQQMRGSGSPTSMSTMRVPPKVVSRTTIALGLGRDLRRCAAASARRVGPHRRAGRRRPRRGHDGDDLALVGDVERIDAEQVAGAGHGRVAPAAGPRRARRRGRCRGPARCRRCRRRRASGRATSASTAPPASRSSTRSPSGAVSERMSASRARSPRASITAMPWSAIVPETSTTSPARTRARARARDRPARRRRRRS